MASTAVIVTPRDCRADARAQRFAVTLSQAGYQVNLLGCVDGEGESGTAVAVPCTVVGPGRPEPRVSLRRTARRLCRVLLRRELPLAALKATARIDEAMSRIAAKPRRDVHQQLRDHLAALKPDLIICDATLLGPLRLRGSRIVADITAPVDGLPDCRSVLAASPELAQGISAAHVIPNLPLAAPPTDADVPLTLRRVLGITDAPLIAVADASLEHVSRVLTAMRRHPELHVACIGPNDAPAIRAEAQRLQVDARCHLVAAPPEHGWITYIAGVTGVITDEAWCDAVASAARVPSIATDSIDHLIANPTSFTPTTHGPTFETIAPRFLTACGLPTHTLSLVDIRDDQLRRRVPLANRAGLDPRPWLRIGAKNIGGQTQLWATSLMRHYPRAIAESVWADIKPGGMRFDVDERVSLEDWTSPAWQRQLQLKMREHITHVICESGGTLVGTAFGTRFTDEQQFYRDADIRSALLFHGSDIRNPAMHAKRYPTSPFRDTSNPLYRRLQHQVEQLTPLVLAFEGPTFVTTHDLFDYLPEATWLPFVIDTRRWAPPETSPQRDALVVFHAPTNPALKGSDAVDRVCQQLEREGLIRYVRPGRLSRQEMRNLVLASDIVVDQLRLGDYGITAAEAMAAGRIVVAHIDDRVRQRMPEDPPIVEADETSLELVLRTLIADPEVRLQYRAAGRAYACRWHDGTYSANVLAAFMNLT